MNLQEIKKIMELFDNSDIAKFSLKQEGFELKLQKAGATTYTTTALPQVSAQTPLVAPISAPAVAESATAGAEMGRTFYHVSDGGDILSLTKSRCSTLCECR